MHVISPVNVNNTLPCELPENITNNRITKFKKTKCHEFEINVIRISKEHSNNSKIGYLNIKACVIELIILEKILEKPKFIR